MCVLCVYGMLVPAWTCHGAHVGVKGQPRVMVLAFRPRDRSLTVYCRICQTCKLLEMLLSCLPDTTALRTAAHDQGQLQVSSGTVSLGPHTCAVSGLSTESSPQFQQRSRHWQTAGRGIGRRTELPDYLCGPRNQEVVVIIKIPAEHWTALQISHVWGSPGVQSSQPPPNHAWPGYPLLALGVSDSGLLITT